MLKEYINDPSSLIKGLGSRQLLNWMPDKVYIKILYRLHEGKKINLDSPKLLNEKLQWLKLYDRNPLYTKLVDKYEVKNIIGKYIGTEHIIPTIGIWKKAEEIDFSKLPNEFVLKTTHDSHSIIVCRNKDELDIKKSRKMLSKSLKRNGFWYGREWPYKDVKPRIIAEPLIKNKDKSALVDYKFYCYGGQPIYFMYSLGEAEHNVRNHKFDMNLKSIDGKFKKKPSIQEDDIQLPNNIDEMIEIVKKLCKNFKHIRVDLYNVDGQIYFGEMTFYSSAGFMNIYSKEYSDYLASLIEI